MKRLIKADLPNFKDWIKASPVNVIRSHITEKSQLVLQFFSAASCKPSGRWR